MQEKFADTQASDYLLAYGLETVSTCLKYFTKMADPAMIEVIPSEDSTFNEKLIFVLTKVSESFGSNLFYKVDTELTDDELIKKVTSPLPTVSLSGR